MRANTEYRSGILSKAYIITSDGSEALSGYDSRIINLPFGIPRGASATVEYNWDTRKYNTTFKYKGRELVTVCNDDKPNELYWWTENQIKDFYNNAGEELDMAEGVIFRKRQAEKIMALMEFIG